VSLTLLLRRGGGGNQTVVAASSAYFGTHAGAIYDSQARLSQIWRSVAAPAPNPLSFIFASPQNDLTLQAQIQQALVAGSASTAVKFAQGSPQAVDLTLSAQVQGPAYSAPLLLTYVPGFTSAAPQALDVQQGALFRSVIGAGQPLRALIAGPQWIDQPSTLVFKSLIGQAIPLRALSAAPQAETGGASQVWSASALLPPATGAIVPFVSASPQYVDPPQPSVWTPSFWVITLTGAQLSFATGQISVPSGSGPAGRHRKWYAVKDGYKLLVFESKEAADAARAALKVPEVRRRTIKVKAPKPVEVIDLKVLRREAALNDRLSDYIAYEQNRQYRELIQMRHHLAKDEEDIARALLKLMSYDEITEEEIAIVLAKL
jgi:hypothetical protein